jgi:folate-binding protein YgfZ
MPTATKSELDAILTGAAIFPLDDRAFLRITGADATRWLNGMVTNSIQALAPGEGNYNFLLNAQGRIQGDCTIYRDPIAQPTAFILETDKSQVDTIQQHLDKFIIMDDVVLDRVEKIGIATIGPEAFKMHARIQLGDNEELNKAAAPSSPGSMFHSRLLGPDVITLMPPNPFKPWFESWFPTESAAKQHRERLRDLGAIEVSAKTREAFRILSGTPRFGQDIRDRDLPQETNQTHALHFSKGCYLGQEIVERIRSRGQVHRTFSGFHLTALPASLPAPLISDGKPAGEITSAATIGDQTFALGYIRREALDRNQPFDYEGGTANPATLPFRMTTS